MPVVPYNKDNWNRCRCFDCPVYHSSQCISQKVGMASSANRPEMPSSADGAEGTYCTQQVGKSKCDDLNGELNCICPTCQVWQTYSLTERWFCIGGPAS